jgi:hypothetical protein
MIVGLYILEQLNQFLAILVIFIFLVLFPDRVLAPKLGLIFYIFSNFPVTIP